MSIFNTYPWSNFHRLNADWILKKVETLATAVERIAANVETWAARIQQAETDAAAAVSTATAAQSSAANSVKYTQQVLTAAQARTARENIGAVSAEDITDAVRYSPQNLTATQQARARLNIGATSQNDITLLLATKKYVQYDEQSLTPEQQAQARSNIGASQIGTVPAGAVRYDAAQTLTAEQKAQARENIGANSGSASDDYVLVVSENEQGTGYDVTGNLPDAAQATGRVFIVLEQSGRTREALAELAYTGYTLSSVSAFFADFFAADSVIPNTITQVTITTNGVTVTDIQQQQVPHPAPLGADQGKVLVAGRNTAQWEDRGPLILEFATENPYTVTTPIADIKAAIDAGRQVFFKGIYPVGNGATPYLPISGYGVLSGSLIYIVFGGEYIGQSVYFDDAGDGWTTYEI